MKIWFGVIVYVVLWGVGLEEAHATPTTQKAPATQQEKPTTQRANPTTQRAIPATQRASAKAQAPWRRTQRNKLLGGQEKVAKEAYFRACEAYQKTLLQAKITSNDPRAQKKELRKVIAMASAFAVRFGRLQRYRSKEWLLCAMFRIGESKVVLARLTMTLPLPAIKGLIWNAKKKKLYQAKMRKAFALPLLEMGIRLFKKMLSVAQLTGTDNVCVRSARATVAWFAKDKSASNLRSWRPAPCVTPKKP